MKKNIIKSIALAGTIAVIAGMSVNAYFSSTVTSSGNEITMGTLLAAVDSTTNYSSTSAGKHYSRSENQNKDNFDAYNVVEENADGSVDEPHNFDSWQGANFGDTKSYYFAVRANGSLPMNYRVSEDGSWTSYPRAGVTLSVGTVCPDTLSSDAVEVVELTQFSSDDCDDDDACSNLKNGLINSGTGTYKSGIIWSKTTNISNPMEAITNLYDTSSADIELESGEFVVYKADVQLNSSSIDSNCYQDAEFEYDVTVEAKDPNDTW